VSCAKTVEPTANWFGSTNDVLRYGYDIAIIYLLFISIPAQDMYSDVIVVSKLHD